MFLFTTLSARFVVNTCCGAGLVEGSSLRSLSQAQLTWPWRLVLKTCTNAHVITLKEVIVTIKFPKMMHNLVKHISTTHLAVRVPGSLLFLGPLPASLPAFPWTLVTIWPNTRGNSEGDKKRPREGQTDGRRENISFWRCRSRLFLDFADTS